jgi:hypothetical protein
MCDLWGRTKIDSGVVFATSSLKMGSVHKSVVGSLYPLNIIVFVEHFTLLVVNYDFESRFA